MINFACCQKLLIVDEHAYGGGNESSHQLHSASVRTKALGGRVSTNLKWAEGSPLKYFNCLQQK